MRDQKRLTFWLLTGIALGILLIGLTFFFLSDTRVMMPTESTLPLTGNMHEEKTAQTKILTFTLPEDFEDAHSVLFKTTHTIVDVTVARENIYNYGRDHKPAFISSPGAVWHIVDVPRGSGGYTMSICLSAVYEDYFGNDPVIRYGSREGCTMELIKTSLPIVLVNAIILFVGFSCLLLHSLGWLRNNMLAKNSFLFMGLFSLSIASWSLCQSGFLQFIIPDGPSLYLIDFFSFYIFPACFNLFLASVCKGKNETLFCVFAAGYLVESAVSTVLQFAGVFDMFELLMAGHLLMAINVVSVFFLVAAEIRRENNDLMRKFRIPLYVLVCFAAAELVIYYINNFRQTSFFLPVGTIVFIVMLFSQLIQQYYISLLEEEKMAYFKKLANTDMLTDVFNRNAYEDTLRRLEQQELELRSTCVVMFDINNMKQINDHYGHEKGDQALKTCCRCIQEAFGQDGNCYRIGGDEFVFLCTKDTNLSHCAARFEDMIRAEARQLDFPFGVAIGYASYDTSTDHALRDVIRRSDDMMYINKEMQKKQQKAFKLSTDTLSFVDK